MFNPSFAPDLTGKTCIVTGGARGIGRCIAERLMALNCRVAVIDRIDASDAGFDLFFRGNVAEEADLRAFAGKVVETFGSVDYLVNNACYSNRGILSGCSWDDFNAVFNTGVTAPYFLCLLLKDKFAKGASVVNIASSRAFMSQPDTESYTAAKGGILALTHALAVSLAGVARVNSISPGWIETDPENENTPEDHAQQPVGRIGCPDDIAACCLFLLSDQSGFITGENITVDGGMTKNMIYHGEYGWTFRP